MLSTSFSVNIDSGPLAVPGWWTGDCQATRCAFGEEQFDVFEGHFSAGKIPRMSHRSFHCCTRDSGIAWWVLSLFLAR